MDPLDRVLEALASHGCPAKRSGEGWSSRCPHHEDRAPSLVVTAGEKGVVMHCHAGCRTDDIVSDLGLTMADLFPPDPAKKREGLGKIEATYEYHGEDGQPLYRVLRFEGKDFRQQRWENGDWQWGLKGVKPTLFRLPAVLDEISMGSTIYVAEGEKDVLALVAHGAVATCNSGGAGKWRQEYGKILSNAERVVIVVDRDATGQAHADDIGKSLNGAVFSYVEAKAGKDAADHFAAGFGLEDFVPRALHPSIVLEPAPSQGSVAEKVAPRLRVRSATSFRMQSVLWLPGFEGFIPMGMISMLAGLPGLGKSMFGTYLACGCSQRKQRVVLAAAEDSIEHTLLPRLVAGGADLSYVDFIDYEDEHGDGQLHLPDHEHLLRVGIEALRPELLILDPIGSFMGRSIDVWKDTEVRAALGPLKTLAEANLMAMLMLAHLNKGTGPYLNRVANSAAFGQVVRSGMLWARDPDDPEGEDGFRRILVSGKVNVAARPNGHVYEIHVTSVTGDDGQTFGTARLEFRETTRRSTDELLAQRNAEGAPGPAVQDAMDHLRAYLATGGKSRKQILGQIKDWGVSQGTLDRALVALKAERVPLGFQQGVEYRLP